MGARPRAALLLAAAHEMGRLPNCTACSRWPLVKGTDAHEAGVV
jgi:hypothetical protein